MEEIIPKIPRDLIKAELTPEKKLRTTNKSGNEIYIVTWQEAPNVVREIGRLREIAFRQAGGGTGKSMDLDDFDTCDNPYRQLLVWDPEQEEILGGYRYILGSQTSFDDNGQPILATSHLFHFSQKFIDEYLPNTIELGRSFVATGYQSSKMGSKGIFALDNLWDGLGALTLIEPATKYFFGKFTMYPSFDRLSRDMILCFLQKHFEDTDRLVVPISPLSLDHSLADFEDLFVEKEFKRDYRILNKQVRERGCNIPPLVNAYMNLSPTMKVFGTAINDEFGDVEESGILIAVDEILPDKRIRHIDTFAAEHPELVEAAKKQGRIFYNLDV